MSNYAPRGIYPEGVKWDTPITGGTLTGKLDEAIAKFAHRPAINFMGYKLNYRELGEKIDDAARGLAGMVQPGDRVGLFMPNTPYSIIMFFAALKAGATVVNFSSAYKDYPEKLKAQARDSGTRLMVKAITEKMMNRTPWLIDHGVMLPPAAL